MHFWSCGSLIKGVVGCGKGVIGHRGIQLILAYGWARLAILVAGKGRGECFYFFCFFTFICVTLSSLSLSFISPSISFLPFSGRGHKMTLGWSGVVKVSCILRHWGVQLILAYSWARLAILVAGNGSGECFYFFFFYFFPFIPVTLSFLSLSFISPTVSSISFLPFSGRWHKMTHNGWNVIKSQHNQSVVL